MMMQFAQVIALLITLVTQSSPPPPSEEAVALIIESVRGGENWIHDVDGMLIRFEGGWTHHPKAIAQSRKRLAGFAIDGKLDPNLHPDLKPKTSETIELAFDKNRVRKCVEQHGFSRRVNVWDGSRATTKSEYFAHKSESYAIDVKPYRLVGEFYFIDITWLRAGPHKFWWIDPKSTWPAESFGRAEDFKFKGLETFRGVECHVLEYTRNGFPIQWFVSVETKQLIRHLTIGPGYKFDHWLGDYKEIELGRWMPMTQGYTTYDIDEKGNDYESGRREFKVVEVRINPTLSDEMFAIEIPENAKITDYTHDPSLFYRYKKNMGEDEWHAILKEADERHEQETSIRMAQEKLVGKTAPSFPKGKWINSKPMTWKELAGKVVVLDFWSTTCGPCRAHLPKMNEFNKLRNKFNVVVIGIHSAERSTNAVEEFVQKNKLEYPIFVEVLGDSPYAGFGTLFDGFGVQGIPYTVIVDKEGKIGHPGTWLLESAWGTARSMAATD